MAHHKVEFLKDCRYYLEKVHLCNREPYRIGIVPIPHIVMNFACVSPIVITFSCLLRYCIQSGFNLNAMSNAFAICMGSAQIILIYITLAIERSTILETIDQMQEIVDKRKSIKFISISKINNKKLSTIN